MKVYYFILKTAQRAAMAVKGRRAVQTVHRGEVLTVALLSQPQAALPLWFHAFGRDEQNGQ